jgi:CHAT domain-containing protein
VQAVSADDPLADDRLGLLDEIAGTRKALSSRTLSSDQRNVLLGKLYQLEEQELSLRLQIAENDRMFAALRGVSLPTIKDLQRSLEDDQAILSFLVQDNPGLAEAKDRHFSSWCLLITREAALTFKLGDLAGLARRTRLYLSMFERRDGSERPGSERLFSDLFSSALSDIPDTVSRLVIIPDGALHRIPFGALSDPESGRYLAEDFEVTVAPSAATWLRLRSGNNGGDRSLLALAAGTALEPLPHADQEIRKMSRHIGGRNLLLSGWTATEEEVLKADPSRFRMIHLAAHAVINDEHPERSYVALGNEEQLTYQEVLDLDLEGQLVLLSACRSGSGPVIGGEGVMTLGGAFFQAGARSVVAGLWPVRDRETAALIDIFGHHLADGQSVSSALASARRYQISIGSPPAAWAGMVALGDGDLAPFADRKRSGSGATVTFFSLLSALLCTLAVIIFRKSSKKT